MKVSQLRCILLIAAFIISYSDAMPTMQCNECNDDSRTPNTNEESYGGGRAFIGGLIGGGLGSTLGGVGGEEASILLGALGGTIGGAIGSATEPKSSGMSVLGGTLGGTLGAGLLVKYKDALEKISPFKTVGGNSGLEDIPSQLLGGALDAVKDNLKTITDPVGAVVGALNPDSLTNSLKAIPEALNLDTIKNPVESISKLLPNSTLNLTSLMNAGNSTNATNPLDLVTAVNPLTSTTVASGLLGRGAGLLGVTAGRQLGGIGSLVSAPLGLAKDAVSTVGSTVMNMGFLKLLLKPMADIASGGILGAFGGGMGSYFGSWSLDAIRNLIVRFI